MHSGQRYLSSLLLAAALVAPLASIGCAEHHSYRAYDPGYNDYHRWDRNEDVYYHQWVVENHREDRDFRKLSPEDQRQYWAWRHNHNDHDHDRDHDHDKH